MKNLNVNKSTNKKSPSFESKQKFKISILSGTITTLICAAVTHASDIEIYKVPEDSVGSTTLLLMLDTSGSMAWTMGGSTSTSTTNPSRLNVLKQGLKDVLSGTPAIPRVADKIVMGLADFGGDNGRMLVPAKPLGEIVRENGVEDGVYKKPLWQQYSRDISSIKTTSPNKGSTVYIKTTYYNTCTKWDINNNYDCLDWSGETTTKPSGYKTSGYKTDKNISCIYGDYSDCLMVWDQPKKYRDETHRDVLLTKIDALKTNGGTPTPYAYAEAAAYMMGTSPVKDGYQVYFVNSSNHYIKCSNWNDDGTCKNNSWNGWYSNFDSSGYLKGGVNTLYNEKGNYYLGLNPTVYSGFSSSIASSKNGNYYIAPSSITAQLGTTEAAKNKRECSGQGIYFLTDGEPEPNGTATGTDGKSGTAYELMSKSLGNKSDLFSCLNSELGKRSTLKNEIYSTKTSTHYGYKNAANSWNCIGNYAQSLLNSSANPLGLQIKTAVVGFGDGFNSTNNLDVQDAKDWGTIGGGKWYVGTNSQSVVDSINKFIEEINKDIPSMSTGSSTIPMDALNLEVIQPYAYFPQFEPKVNTTDKQQLWFGNLKKYYVVNNGIYANKSGTEDSTVVLKSKLQDWPDIWSKSGMTYDDKTPVYQKYGVLSHLSLGTKLNGKLEKVTGRNLLTDYSYDDSKTENEKEGRDFNLVQIKYTYTTDNKTKTDAKYARSLMALLGYDIPTEVVTNGYDLDGQNPSIATLRQMGSISHSLPVLLTQEGKAVAKLIDGKVVITSEDRKDYVMFGTTQGLLHVVDAKDGTEKFSFLPKEMLEKQKDTLLKGAGNLAGGKEALYYGIDGEWVAHTVYVTKPDGTLTVKGSVRDIVGGTEEDKENLNGKQWVYGGMRMGGRSYYSLDLTDIDKPKQKFHIDPATAKVYSKAFPSGKSFAPISNMGQSWSKPRLDYINWKGQRKLVMFVGGGYDAGGTDGDGLFANGIRTGYAGYEYYNYTQANKKGSGIYMFDADNGDLLWYADSTQTTTLPDSDTRTGVITDEKIAHVTNADLKYSVVSEIKTIDRNNDGIVDHLYFGDLAGQAFRIDLKNDKDFSTQATKILNLNQTNGTSPRFYMPPVFTAHHSDGKKEGANVIVASFISGNKSSPLLATTDSHTTTGKLNSLGLQYDGVYAVYDYDIHPNGTFYPQAHISARTLATTDANASLSLLKNISTIVRSDNDTTLVKGAAANLKTGWGGWYYRFNKKMDETTASESVIKGLTPLVAMEGNLYATMYDASSNGTTSSCGAGVKGHSFTKRLCLPTGVCAQDANFTYNLGAGIVNLNVGPTDDGGGKSIIVPDPKDIGTGCVGKDCSVTNPFIRAGGSMRFIPNRWYEQYAKGK